MRRVLEVLAVLLAAQGCSGPSASPELPEQNDNADISPTDVKWMYDKSTWIATLGDLVLDESGATREFFPSDCVYGLRMGEAKGDLNQKPFQRFTLPPIDPYSRVELVLTADYSPSLVCVTGLAYQNCGQPRSSRIDGGVQRDYQSFALAYRPEAPALVLVTSQAAYQAGPIATPPLLERGGGFGLYARFFTPRQSDGGCPAVAH
jgi:hypothetical protein